MKGKRLAITFVASVLAHFGFVLFTHAGTAFWAVFGTLTGLALAISAGAATYRYGQLRDWSHGDGMAAAVLAMAFFPISLPLMVMCWTAVWPTHKEVSQIRHRERLAALEAEAFGPLKELP